MSDGADGKSSWARYIEAAVARPGWSVARLARDSGVHRSTIFRWIKGEGGKVTVDSVRRIALALNENVDEALRAAGDLVADVAGADDDDEMALIMRAPVDDALKQIMIAKLRERREREKQQRIADFTTILELAKRED